MGAREDYETVTRVIQAFAGQRTWRQADLAREVGIQARSLRTVLGSLRDSGMPLDREEEHPHVFWSVPQHWFPGGVIFDVEDWQVLVHAVLRIADPQRRRKLVSRLLSGRRTLAAAADGVARLNEAIAGTPITAEEHEKLLIVEQSVIEQVPLAIFYYSASGGRLTWRTVTPLKLFTEPHGRLCAYCHTHEEIRWFRIDNIQRARLDPEHKRQCVEPSDVDAFLSSSVDGYRDGTNEEHAFRVRSPESGWVKGNLLPGMSVDAEARGEGLRVVARGAALIVARYIAGLGGAAVAEGDQLRLLVRQLAEAAAEANR